MKSISKLIALTVAALVLVAATRAHALTLIVYVNPTTWAIDTSGYAGDANPPNFADTQASHQDQYGYWHYRYYTGGLFDTVVIERSDNHATLQTLSCNNMFYIDRSVPWGYKCDNGYNGGSSDGVSGGAVLVGKAFSNGDFYIGGDFTTAGGWQYSSHFSCYRWTEGWSGVNGVFANNAVTQLSWDINYKLVLQGSFTYVYGPLSSGGASGYDYTYPPHWIDYYKTFPNAYWNN